MINGLSALLLYTTVYYAVKVHAVIAGLLNKKYARPIGL